VAIIEEITIEQATTFDEIKEIRKGFRSAARQNKIDFTSALAEANKKPAHFVLELLQNAEDANASEVDIRLFQDRFVFSHNGNKKFRLRDIRGITGLGDSGKDNDDNAIGHFGMGFKSVFGICTTPEIYAECDFEPSHSIAFKIEDLFVPEHIDKDDRYKKGTHFVLRFENADMTTEQAYNLLLEELATLNSDCILFLRNIRKVTWKVDGADKGDEFHKGKKDEPINDIATYRTIYSGDAIESQYLFFERSFEFDDKKFFVSVAYRIEKDKAGKKFLALEKADTKLFVFFPCEGENTYLKFKINAPFMTTSNRDAIIEKEKYRVYNNRILDEIIELYVDSLPCIKENGYFDTAFLSLLPINKQLSLESGKFAQPFYLKTVEVLKTGEYLPTADGGHAKASQALLVGSKDLIELLDDNDAANVFAGRRKWLDSTITSNGATASLHSFIKELDVPDIDASAFIRTVTDKFIAGKTDEWLIKFYKTMTNIAMVRHYLFKKFIRLENNDTMVAPFEGEIPNVFLPKNNQVKSKSAIKSIFCENHESLEFFKYIGITTADVVDEIRDFVGELQKCKDEADYLFCIDLVVEEYYGKDVTEEQRCRIVDILRGECCVLCEDETGATQERLKPTDAFFRHNDVEKIYKDISNIWYVSKALVSKADMNLRVVSFLKILGVSASIKLVEKHSGLTGDELKQLRHGASCTSSYQSGWQIDKIEVILAAMTQEKSQALWKIIDGLDSKYFIAKYTWWYAWSGGKADFKAYFIQALQKSKWLYNEQGEKVVPSEIYYDDALKVYPQSKIIEDNLDFLPNRIKELSQEVQTRIEVTAGVPIEVLMRYCDEYRKTKEADEEFNPVDISECDIPQAEDAFVNPRSGIDEDALDIEENKNRQENTDSDLSDALSIIYGGSQINSSADDDASSEANNTEDNENENANASLPTYVPRKDTSEEQKEVCDWSENWVLKRVLKTKYEKVGCTIKDETEYGFLAEKDGETLMVTRHNDGKKNQRGFDISVKRGEETDEFIEVKASKYDTDEFHISASQWEFAKTLRLKGDGDRYFVYFVPRAGTKQVGLSILQNPHQKWLDGNLAADPIGIRLVKNKRR
jgi:hypothetical protein